MIADEIYERLDYGEEKHVSFAALGATAFDRTVTINGFSKAFAMTGFRLGYLAAPAPVAAACAKIQGQITSCASSLAQAAGVAALGLAPDALDADVEVFRGRRDRVLSDLGEIAAAKGRVAVPPAPGGAFYVFFDVSGCLGLRAPDGAKIATSTQFCESLLAHRKLALVPGDAFGDGAGCRLSYAASDEELAAAMAALLLLSPALQPVQVILLRQMVLIDHLPTRKTSERTVWQLLLPILDSNLGVPQRITQRLVSRIYA